MRKFLSLSAALLLLTTILFAQTRMVTGKVTDAQGQPIPFASIRIKGGAAGTSADGDGNYSIRAKPGDVLLISGTGINAREMTVTGDGAMNIAVTRNTSPLTEVVVTALGIQRQAKELGYATATVNSKTLTQAKAVGVAQALNGKVSGLNISTVNSGVFENAKINIRGIRSLTGNNQPLLVVDGAPTPLNFLSSIPPDDIQDVTVLKSAASAAIYGPDAVNGVIVVTTKRGGKRPTITFNSNIQLSRVTNFPKLQRSFGQGGGEIVDQYGNFGHVPYENQQYGPRFDGTMKPIGIVLQDGSQQMGPYNDGHYNDKVKFWNTGLTFQNAVSVAGEDFYFSFEDANIKGLTPHDVNRRTSLRFNGGKKYGNFSVSYGLNYILQNYSIVNENGFQNTFPGAYDGGLFFLVLQTASNVPLLNYKDLNSKYGNFSNYYNEYAVSPYWLIENIRRNGRIDDLIGNVTASYQFFPWLKGTVRLSSNLEWSNYKNTNNPVVVSDWAVAHRNATQYSNRLGLVFDDQYNMNRINFDYFLSGNHKLSSDFGIGYVAGGMVRQDRQKDVAVGGNNLVVPYFNNVSVRSGDANVPLYPSNNYTIESRLYSFYGQVTFNYKDWAFLDVTGRNDWDSRLLEKNRSFFYPGANASVILSDAIESLKNSQSISYFKVHGAISKSGNVNLNPYNLSATYSQPAGFPFGSHAGFTANNTIPSPNLKPEFVKTVEAGVELGFIHNRVNFNATWFNQNNTNQILAVTQSGTTGYTNLLANAADFKNYGVEMDLNLTPLIKIGKGRIDFRMNATYNNNKVTATLNNANVVIGGNSGFIQNAVGYPTVNNIAIVGKPAFQFQLSDYLRDSATGKVIVDPVTGYPTQSQGLAIRGRSLPLWVLGFTPSYSITSSVGEFAFSMTWDYKTGHNFYSGLGPDEDFAGISARSAEYGRKRFVFPNSVYLSGSKYVPNTNIQTQDGNYGFWTGANTNTGIATNYYASATALRLREVNLSYTLPARWLWGGTGAIKRVTVSFIARNLFLFTPKSNQWGDPEFNYATGGNTLGVASGFQSPPSRLFGGSLTVQF